MTIWDDITKNVNEVASATAKKAGELTNVAKTRVAIYAEQSKLSRAYEDIGRLYYEGKRTGADNVAKIASLFVTVEDATKEIARLKASLARAVNSVICPSCGAKYRKTFAFCPHCGTKNEGCCGDKDGCADDKHGECCGEKKETCCEDKHEDCCCDTNECCCDEQHDDCCCNTSECCCEDNGNCCGGGEN
jgi:hypothetical protein